MSNSAFRWSVLCRDRARRDSLGRIADPNRVSEFVKHRFKPFAVTARLNPNNYWLGELSLIAANVLKWVVHQPKLVDFAIASLTPVNELLSCMKIYATINSHGDSFIQALKLRASLSLATRQSHLFHHIR